MRTLQLIIAILLFPLTIWYSVGVAVRNLLYRSGLKKSLPSDIPTIGIGNLRMGGTGKTPHTEYLVRLFSDRRTALLSRGYGRKTKGFVLADKNQNSSIQDSELLGDEPTMLAHKFPDLTVAVCEDRVEGIRHLSEMPNPPELVLLDDVYQHRHIKPTLTILLTEYGDPFSDDHILPFGNLREFRSGRRRADIVVVTKCPPSMSDTKRNEYRERLKLAQDQQLFFSHIDYLTPQALYGDIEWKPVKEVLLLTGIAHPGPLKHHIEKHCTVKHLSYPDHHNFGTVDCHRIVTSFRTIKEQSKAVITTEKDAMRLLTPTAREQLQHLPVFYIPIRVSIDGNESFEQTIKKFV